MPESDANDSKQNAEPRQAVIYEGLSLAWLGAGLVAEPPGGWTDIWPSRTPRCRATKGMGGKVKP
jgi:hypothetical protein